MPMTTGLSGSPSLKATITSWPMRGQNDTPQRLPAIGCETRTQQELFSSFLPSRSQKNCTLMRPYLSVCSSWPFGPTTTAGCGPLITGRGVTRGGRKVTLSGMQVNVLEYSEGVAAVLRLVSEAEWLTEVIT